MTKIKIGTGGWAYFNVPGDRLKHYSRVFDIVEVNSTFYKYPSLDLTRSWRRRTPKNFDFTVRCHRDLTHRYRLQPIKPAFKVLERMIEICKILRAEILQIQTSSIFELSERLNSIEEFLSSTNPKKLRIAWEIRSRLDQHLKEELIKIMKDHNIIHCVDISKGEEPIYKSDILYSRLFGKGKHNIYQYNDEELKDINKKAENQPNKTILNFHTIRQYKDAARLTIFRLIGKFPKVSTKTGIKSLIEVMKDDTKFPTTRTSLIKDQGWKLFDWKNDQRRRVSEILEMLPDISYKDLTHFVEILKENKIINS